MKHDINVLIIKNRVKVKIDDDIKRAFEFLERKTPANYNLEYMDVDIPVELTVFKKRQDGRKIYGTYKTKDKLRSKVPFGKYHIVLFYYDVEEQAIEHQLKKGGYKDGYVTSWCLWNELFPDTEFCEIITSRRNDRSRKIDTSTSHEMMHALLNKAKRAGRGVIDHMDKTIVNGKLVFYYKNNDREAHDGNYARSLKELNKHWDIVPVFRFKKQWEAYQSAKKQHVAKPVKINFTTQEMCITKDPISQDVSTKLWHYHILPMQKVRDIYGKPIFASMKSGYRPYEYELSQGRSGRSEHVFMGNGAVDWRCADMPILIDLIKKHIPYTRMADYGTFVHCDYKATKTGKREFYTVEGGKWKFAYNF